MREGFIGPHVRIPSGVGGLDEMLAGGLLPGRPYLIVGPPGSGKTTLAMQFLLQGAKRGEDVLYVTLEEPPNEVKEDFKGFPEALRKVWIFDAIPDVMRYEKAPFKDIAAVREARRLNDIPRGVRQTDEFRSVEIAFSALMQTLKMETTKRLYTRVVIDSLTALKYFCMKGFDDATGAQVFLRFIAEMRITTLLLVESPLDDAQLPERMLARGEIHLYNWESDRRLIRAIGIEKFRGSPHDNNMHPYRIASHGIAVDTTVSISKETREILPLPPSMQSFAEKPSESELVLEAEWALMALLEDVRELLDQGIDAEPVRELVQQAHAVLSEMRVQEALALLLEARERVNHLILVNQVSEEYLQKYSVPQRSRLFSPEMAPAAVVPLDPKVREGARSSLNPLLDRLQGMLATPQGKVIAQNFSPSLLERAREKILGPNATKISPVVSDGSVPARPLGEGVAPSRSGAPPTAPKTGELGPRPVTLPTGGTSPTSTSPLKEVPRTAPAPLSPSGRELEIAKPLPEVATPTPVPSGVSIPVLTEAPKPIETGIRAVTPPVPAVKVPATAAPTRPPERILSPVTTPAPVSSTPLRPTPPLPTPRTLPSPVGTAPPKPADSLSVPSSPSTPSSTSPPERAGFTPPTAGGSPRTVPVPTPTSATPRPLTAVNAKPSTQPTSVPGSPSPVPGQLPTRASEPALKIQDLSRVPPAAPPVRRENPLPSPSQAPSPASPPPQPVKRAEPTETAKVTPIPFPPKAGASRPERPSNVPLGSPPSPKAGDVGTKSPAPDRGTAPFVPSPPGAPTHPLREVRAREAPVETSLSASGAPPAGPILKEGATGDKEASLPSAAARNPPSVPAVQPAMTAEARPAPALSKPEPTEARLPPSPVPSIPTISATRAEGTVPPPKEPSPQESKPVPEVPRFPSPAATPEPSPPSERVPGESTPSPPSPLRPLLAKEPFSPPAEEKVAGAPALSPVLPPSSSVGPTREATPHPAGGSSPPENLPGQPGAASVTDFLAKSPVPETPTHAGHPASTKPRVPRKPRAKRAEPGVLPTGGEETAVGAEPGPPGEVAPHPLKRRATRKSPDGVPKTPHKPSAHPRKPHPKEPDPVEVAAETPSGGDPNAAS